jgi:argininosuccinate synthase
MVLPSDLLHLKASLEPTYASLIYSGQWFSPTRQALEAFMASSQGRVTGTVTLKLFGGGHQVVSRWSPFSLYRPHLATYGLGDAFDARAAEGFLYIQSLASRTWAEAALQERHLQEVS